MVLFSQMNEQRTKLLEATQQSNALTEALEKKDVELKCHLQHIAEQEATLDQRAELIKVLQKREEEQHSMIKLLRDNLEMHVQTDADVSCETR